MIAPPRPARISTVLDGAGFGEIIGLFPQARVLVIGDLMLDEFIWGKVSRISPEAPVPIVDVTSTSYYPGGAANVARNLREFTGAVSVVGQVGEDAHGSQLLRLLQASGIGTAGVRQSPECSTSVKIRVIARNQHVVRVDREHPAAQTGQRVEEALEYVESAMTAVDAIVVADYGKGFLSQPMADGICALSKAHGTILTVDPHPRTSLVWPGATAVKPNRLEAFQVAGLPLSEPVEPVSSDNALIEVGRRLLRHWDAENLLVTLGEQGMVLFREGAPPHHTPARARGVYDVSGAGDTAISVFTLALCAGATPVEAAELANCASGIVVGKLGTATLNAAELQAGFAAL